MRIPITKQAKKSARMGLELRKKQENPSGLTKSEAAKIGVNSGVQRARQLVNNKTISVQDAKSIRNFLNRFKNARSKRSEIAIMLWGGREFRSYLDNILKSMNK